MVYVNFDFEIISSRKNVLRKARYQTPNNVASTPQKINVWNWNPKMKV